MSQDDRTFLTTLKYTLLTRKFLTALLSFLGMLLARYANVPDDVIGYIALLGGIVIAGIAYEDAAGKRAPQNVQADTYNEAPQEATEATRVP